MKIIVGLGNFEAKYKNTRHNCGFMALDKLVEHIENEENVKVTWNEDSKFKAYTAKIPYKNRILFLAKPTTYMNRSGDCISNILNFFKEPLENLLVIFDDIDLPLGTVKIKEKGSAGTHNGMKSIIQTLNSEEFSRIKIGIESRGEHAPKQQDLSNFVLSDFTSAEIPLLKKSLEEAVEKIKSKINLT